MVTDEKIYFFTICKETMEPTLENVMYNTMDCSHMMFGTKVRYGISYKANQPNMNVYTRKYFHNFKVSIRSDNHEGAIGANLSTMNAYLLAEKTHIGIYDERYFDPIQEFEVPTSADDILILYVTLSPDENKIGIVLGRNLIKEK